MQQPASLKHPLGIRNYLVLFGRTLHYYNKIVVILNYIRTMRLTELYLCPKQYLWLTIWCLTTLYYDLLCFVLSSQSQISITCLLNLPVCHMKDITRFSRHKLCVLLKKSGILSYKKRLSPKAMIFYQTFSFTLVPSWTGQM